MEKMIEQTMIEQTPATLDDCVRPDALSSQLWSWAQNLEKYGQWLLVLIVVGGILTSYFGAQVETSASSDPEFSPILFLSSFLQTIVYALVEYFLYHVLSLLVASLAKLVHNTRTAARIAEYRARKAEQSE